MPVGEKIISAFIYEMAMQMVHQASQTNGFQFCFTSAEQLKPTSMLLIATQVISVCFKQLTVTSKNTHLAMKHQQSAAAWEEMGFELNSARSSASSWAGNTTQPQ